MDKEIEQKLKEQRDQFTVVLEDIQSHNRVFGELLLSVREDVAVLKEDVAVLKEDVAILKYDVSSLKKDMIIVKDEVGRLREDVTVMNEGKADKSEVISLNSRVSQLEAVS